jgi:hypothetical protein
MIETFEQAKAVLQDTDEEERIRVHAAEFLAENGTAEAANLLVAALDNDDYGVHWAASEGLAAMGETALPAMLRALVAADCSPRVIHGAKHAFHTSSSLTVREETKGIVAAMHGPAQTIGVMQVANELMIKLSIS